MLDQIKSKVVFIQINKFPLYSWSDAGAGLGLSLSVFTFICE